MKELLRVERLVKHFEVEGGLFVHAVDDVSFTIERSETLGLVGESGSGKTTVGRCVLRLIKPTAGRIVFDGVDITTFNSSELRPLRRRMSIVFQDPLGSLNPRMSVRDTVEEPLRFMDNLTPSDRFGRVLDTLDAVQLSSAYLSRFPHELTESEQQRVAIARAIVTRGDLVVIDEATSSLDPSVRAFILRLLRDLQTELGISYLFISHDLTAVQRISHRIAIMYLGHIVEVASTEAIFDKQLHPYSRALLSAVLYPNPAQKLEPFVLTGEIPSPINPPEECPLVSRCPFAQPECRDGMPPLLEVEPGHWSACFRSSEFIAEGVPARPSEAAAP
jgi:oligopeptide/dipeptide ABC transporter ATP-binding protein